ncbi:hypothetical protein [Streptomyces maremycinicus]|uniref:hypothetical protein n=1 Tax=Streptomyces maremycinicus TaxID=1679753 RepID=UPI001331221D|nr:hypothetical protein [Streptomyces sp. NBRC 110468]
MRRPTAGCCGSWTRRTGRKAGSTSSPAAARRVDKDALQNTAWLLGEILADWSQPAAEAVAAGRAKGHGPPATVEVTRVGPDPGGALLQG